MKQAYTSLTPATGAHVAGIVSIALAPREWLAAEPVVDFNTGKILVPLSFVAGKSLLPFQLVPDGYDYTEKPKSNKSGSFYEVSCTGTLNALTPEGQQVLESLRYHELVAVVKDRKKRNKLIGTKTAGAVLQVGYRQNSTEALTLELSIEVEERPPFYL